MIPLRSDRSPTPRLTLALLPSLGTTSRIWDGILLELEDVELIDVLLFELPGHGGTGDRPAFTVTGLGEEIVLQIEVARRTQQVVVAGVSMGGALALEIARMRPGWLAGFVSFNSSLRFGSQDGWARIIDGARVAGTAAFDPDGTRAGWFTASFAEGRGAARVAASLEDLAAVDVDGYISCCRALSAYDGRNAVASVEVPGLAVGGSLDSAVAASETRRICSEGDDVRYAELPGAHLAVVEDAAAAAAVLAGFMRELRVGLDAGSG